MNSPWQFPDSRLLLFAKAPVRGRVKTRLQPALGEAGALALYQALLNRTARLLDTSGLAPWQLWAADDSAHEAFLSLRSASAVYQQQGSDLGARMDHATTTALVEPGVDAVIIIGTDCPILTADYLSQALTALDEGREAVLGPAEDGGYVLVGLRRPLPAMFRAIDWGSDRVLAQTVAALEAGGHDYTLLESVWDVDRPEDLPRLRDLDPPLVLPDAVWETIAELVAESD